MTMEAPWDSNHPVSGTRQFGYEINEDGSYNFFVRGVDRFSSNLQENVAFILSGGNPFFAADILWETFQSNFNDFIIENGGDSTILEPIHNRPDWDEVEEVLNGNRPISDLGCN